MNKKYLLAISLFIGARLPGRKLCNPLMNFSSVTQPKPVQRYFKPRKNEVEVSTFSLCIFCWYFASSYVQPSRVRSLRQTARYCAKGIDRVQHNISRESCFVLENGLHHTSSETNVATSRCSSCVATLTHTHTTVYHSTSLKPLQSKLKFWLCFRFSSLSVTVTQYIASWTCFSG